MRRSVSSLTYEAGLVLIPLLTGDVPSTLEIQLADMG